MLLMCSMYIFFFKFSNKLIPLLSLEMMMMMLIFSIFYSKMEYFCYSYSILIIFLVMMVLDSVLGLSILISSCRLNNKKIYSFF